MTGLVAGLVLFVGVHLLPAIPGVRPALRARLGEGPVKGLVSLGALVGLVLIVASWSSAPVDAVHAPPPWTRHLAWTAVPLAFVMLTSAYVPSRIGWFLGHPMSLAVVLWGTVHAAANHERRAVVLFGTLAGWGLVAWLLAARRDGWRPKPWPEQPRDGVVVVAGLAVAGAVMAAHGWLFGVPVVP